MKKARYNTEPYSNLRVPLNNVKPSNFWESHQQTVTLYYTITSKVTLDNQGNHALHLILLDIAPRTRLSLTIVQHICL